MVEVAAHQLSQKPWKTYCFGSLAKASRSCPSVLVRTLSVPTMASSAEQKSVAPNNFLSAGRGLVPSMPSLLTAASKQFCEAASEGDTLVYHGMTRMLDFSREGVSPDELRAFLHEALDAGRSHEPTVESGNKYGVSDQVRKDYDLIRVWCPQLLPNLNPILVCRTHTPHLISHSPTRSPPRSSTPSTRSLL